MKLTVNMDHDFGGYDIEQYEVRVSRHGGGVVSVAFHGKDSPMQKGGGLVIPAEVAARLGAALLVASHGNVEGLVLPVEE